jgi:hypothetical protein
MIIYALPWEIQLSRGEGWDPVIKRRGLGSSYQEERVGIPLTCLTRPHCCTCLKPGPRFPKSHVVVFFCVHWEGERWLFCVFFSQISFVCFVDIDGICEHHCLSSLSYRGLFCYSIQHSCEIVHIRANILIHLFSRYDGSL